MAGRGCQVAYVNTNQRLEDGYVSIDNVYRPAPAMPAPRQPRQDFSEPEPRREEKKGNGQKRLIIALVITTIIFAGLFAAVFVLLMTSSGGKQVGPAPTNARLEEWKMAVNATLEENRSRIKILTNQLENSEWKSFVDATLKEYDVQIKNLRNELVNKSEAIAEINSLMSFSFSKPDCRKVSIENARIRSETGGTFAFFSFGMKYEVYCDLTTDEGGWIVFQRRKDGSVSFGRNWEDYVKGFGRPQGEYWLGLEKLHRLTSSGKYELRVDLGDWEGTRKFAKYGNFSVAGADEKYRLHVAEYTGDAGNSLEHHDKYSFSALDQDNDIADWSCARSYGSGWWFRKCFNANLNGAYLDPRNATIAKEHGIIWRSWGDFGYPLKFTEMKIRQKN